MKTLSQLAMGVVTVGFLLLSSGCVVAPAGPDRREVRDERWCANHPKECDHDRWCADHPYDCGH
jgi:hypothetical protein